VNPRRPKTALREFISQVDCNDYEGFVQQFDRSIQTFAKVKSEFELLFNKFALSASFNSLASDLLSDEPRKRKQALSFVVAVFERHKVFEARLQRIDRKEENSPSFPIALILKEWASGSEDEKRVIRSQINHAYRDAQAEHNRDLWLKAEAKRRRGGKAPDVPRFRDWTNPMSVDDYLCGLGSGLIYDEGLNGYTDPVWSGKRHSFKRKPAIWRKRIVAFLQEISAEPKSIPNREGKRGAREKVYDFDANMAVLTQWFEVWLPEPTHCLVIGTP